MLHKRLISCITLSLLTPYVVPAIAAQTCDSTSDVVKLNVVKNMYKSPTRKLYSEKLRYLVEEEDKCYLSKGSACKMKLDPLYYSANPPAYSEARFEYTCSDNVVYANVYDKASGDSKLIRFKLVKENNAWRINDILYPSGPSLRKALAMQ